MNTKKAYEQLLAGAEIEQDVFLNKDGRFYKRVGNIVMFVFPGGEYDFCGIKYFSNCFDENLRWKIHERREWES